MGSCRCRAVFFVFVFFLRWLVGFWKRPWCKMKKKHNYDLTCIPSCPDLFCWSAVYKQFLQTFYKFMLTKTVSASFPVFSKAYHTIPSCKHIYTNYSIESNARNMYKLSLFKNKLTYYWILTTSVQWEPPSFTTPKIQS